MLSEIEATYFRSRIDDVLLEGRLTAWQRQFLLDMQDRFRRYGTRTRLSDKQLATLRRLTRIEGDADLGIVVPYRRARPPSTPRYRRYRFSRFEIRMAVFGLVFAAVAVAKVLEHGFPSMLPSGSPAVTSASDFRTQGFSITDGDTIRLDDGTPVRLVGYNAPEVFHPQCDSEADLGHRATERLRQLVASGRTTVTRIACACRPGTEGTQSCNYGRSCGILRVDGQDVGQTLISEGLAVSFVCQGQGCPPTPRPWCG